jgi:P22 coat protein - gene protein 5
MSNTLVNTDLVAREILRIAHEKATFLSTIDRQYDRSYFGVGAKHGASLKVQMPNQYTVRTGRVMNVQDQDEATQTITAGTQVGVDMRFNSSELALNIDQFSKRYVEPATSVLVSNIESAVLQGATMKVANLVGAAGTVPGAGGDTSMIGQARARLNQFLAPMDGRSLQIDSATMASIVNGNKAIFHEGGQVKTAFTEGYYSRGAGFDWYENERTLALLNGSDHTTVTVNDGTIASGDTTLTLAGGNLKAGQVITFGTGGTPVYAVHPETKASYPFLRQFVLTADATTTTTLNEGYISTGAKQNVSNLPVNGNVVTCFGTASTAYRNALAYHRDFAAFVTADLPMMADAAECTVRSQDGISVRVWKGSDIRNDELLMRVDVLYGYAVLRPDWACRINCT